MVICIFISIYIHIQEHTLCIYVYVYTCKYSSQHMIEYAIFSFTCAHRRRFTKSSWEKVRGGVCCVTCRLHTPHTHTRIHAYVHTNTHQNITYIHIFRHWHISTVTYKNLGLLLHHARIYAYIHTNTHKQITHTHIFRHWHTLKVICMRSYVDS